MSNEIVFFDLETNVPNKPGQKFWVLEFGALVLCPRKLVELESYCTLIRPGDLTAVGVNPARCHGISRATVLKAPVFEEVADKIFKILNGRIWAGHNIRRSLDDVRMNLEVLKHCATVLFLESALPGVLGDQWKHENISPTITTRSKSNVMEPSIPTIINKRWHQGATPKMTTRSRSKSNGEETSRKSPSVLSRHRVVPYPTTSFGQMTEKVKNMLRNARTTPLNNLLKHSHSLLR
ncbi:hypothetical protein E3N88_08413 [Mikania micrantha]|uniref:Exonuclease domain-containing protein n=1 Tax=Mikania micrantha TaxID=192012 RepID=A0A5N6PH37_9ASTR|nr:hypothetical protein E3N88_08413 [Mikania micrantha]